MLIYHIFSVGKKKIRGSAFGLHSNRSSTRLFLLASSHSPYYPSLSIDIPITYLLQNVYKYHTLILPIPLIKINERNICNITTSFSISCEIIPKINRQRIPNGQPEKDKPEKGMQKQNTVILLIDTKVHFKTTVI